MTLYVYDHDQAQTPVLTIAEDPQTLALQLLPNEAWCPAVEDLKAIRDALKAAFPTLTVEVLSASAVVRTQAPPCKHAWGSPSFLILRDSHGCFSPDKIIGFRIECESCGWTQDSWVEGHSHLDLPNCNVVPSR